MPATAVPPGRPRRRTGCFYSGFKCARNLSRLWRISRLPRKGCRNWPKPRAMMRNLDELFAALAKSRFRAGCALNAKDRAYLNAKGLPTIVQHAADFVNQRLAPAEPARDGKQTPWRGHP